MPRKGTHYEYECYLCFEDIHDAWADDVCELYDTPTGVLPMLVHVQCAVCEEDYVREDDKDTYTIHALLRLLGAYVGRT